MKKKLTLSFDKKILAGTKKKCAKEKISLSSVIKGFLLQFIKENPITILIGSINVKTFLKEIYLNDIP